MVTAARGSCSVCASAATIADWSPIQDWLTVEGCLCGGFFIWKGLWEERLPGMSEAEREELAARIRAWRAKGQEAWVATADGTIAGPLVIVVERPPLRTGP